jgi:SAM-dependent methyltransferase
MVVSGNEMLCRICNGPMRTWPNAWLGFAWGRCRSCGSVQKLIDKNTFDGLSPSYDPGFLSAHSAVRSELEASMDVNGKSKLLKRLLGPGACGKLLDIGCGMGGFLLAGSRLGYEVFGVEPSASHGKAAVEVFGLNVASGYFNSHNFSSQFDVVILSHVIEHIYRPAEFLADVMRVVAPGGKLIVITPNCESLGAVVCGRYWSMYKPVDHVTLFTKAALKSALPAGSTFQHLDTSEWPGEFAAHIASALRTAMRPQMANVGGTSDVGSVRQSTIGPALRLFLAVLSFPFYVAARAADRQSCLYAVITKDSIAHER